MRWFLGCASLCNIMYSRERERSHFTRPQDAKETIKTSAIWLLLFAGRSVGRRDPRALTLRQPMRHNRRTGKHAAARQWLRRRRQRSRTDTSTSNEVVKARTRPAGSSCTTGMSSRRNWRTLPLTRRRVILLLLPLLKLVCCPFCQPTKLTGYI